MPQQNPAIAVVGIKSPLEVRVEDKPILSDATFWLSLIAILVSFFSIYHNNKSIAKARKESIHDHFWFREVIYPEVIKPLNEFCSYVHTNLPKDQGVVISRKRLSNKFFLVFRDQHNLLAQMLIRAGLINKELYIKLSDEFTALEDVVTSYCYSNSTLVNVDPKDRLNALDKIFKVQTNILAFSKSSQENIK